MPWQQLGTLAVSAGLPARGLKEVPRETLERILYAMGLPAQEAPPAATAGGAKKPKKEATVPRLAIPGGQAASMKGLSLAATEFLERYPGKPKGRGISHELEDIPVSVVREFAEKLPAGRAKTRAKGAAEEMGPEAGMVDVMDLIRLGPALVGKMTSRGPVAWYSKPLIEEALAFESTEGQQFGQASKDTSNRTKAWAGRWEKELRKTQKMTAGLPGSSHRKEVKSLITPVGNGFTRLEEIIRGKLKATPKEQEIVDQLEKLRKMIGAGAEELGVMRTDAEGKVSRFKTPKGPLLVRQYTQAMRDLRPDSDAFKQLVADITRMNPELGKGVGEGFLRTNIQQGFTRLDATEAARTIKNFPSSSKVGVKIVHWLEVSPFRYATTLVRNASHRFGFVEVFGQDINLRSLEEGETAPLAGRTGEILKGLVRAEGDRGRKVGTDIFRVLHGLPLSLPMAAKPGTWENELYRYFLHLPAGLWRASKLTKAFIVNLPEAAAAGGTYLGFRRVMKAYAMLAKDVASHAVRREKSEFLKQGEELGVLNFTPLHADWAEGRKIEDAVRVLGGILTTPLRAVQFFQEGVATVAATEFAHDLSKGKGSSTDEASLVQFGFSPARVRDYMSGTAGMRAKGYSRERITRRWGDLIREAVSYSIPGHAQASAQRSRAALSRTFNEFIAFNGYFQARLGQGARLSETFGNDPSAANARLMIKFAALSSATGMVSTLLNALFAGVLYEALREMTKSPVEAVVRGFLSNTVSSHGAMLFEAASSGKLSGAFDHIIEAIPAKSAWGVAKDFATGDGYYEGKGITEDPLAGVAQLLREMPAVGLIENGLFGLTFWQLTDVDQGFKTAERAYYRWLDRNAPLPEFPRGTSPSTRHMRIAWGRLKKFQDWNDPVFLKHVGRAFDAKMEEPHVGDKLDARDALASSIRSRRLLSGGKWRKLTEEQRQSMEDFVGPKGWQKLKDMDTLLEKVAEKIGYSSEFMEKADAAK